MTIPEEVRKVTDPVDQTLAAIKASLTRIEAKRADEEQDLLAVVAGLIVGCVVPIRRHHAVDRRFPMPNPTPQFPSPSPVTVPPASRPSPTPMQPLRPVPVPPMSPGAPYPARFPSAPSPAVRSSR